MSTRAMYIPEVKCILLLKNANYHLSLLEKLVLTDLLSAGLPQSSNLLKKKKKINKAKHKKKEVCLNIWINLSLSEALLPVL